MSNTKTGAGTRTFTHLSKAWYGEANLRNTPDIADKVTLNFFNADGSLLGEFQIAWEKKEDGVVPILKAFDDGWAALARFSDMLNEMATMNDKNVMPDEFCEMLVRLGIKDTTESEDPSEQEQLDCC